MKQCIREVQEFFYCLYPENSENDKKLRAEQVRQEWAREDEGVPSMVNDPFAKQLQGTLDKEKEAQKELDGKEAESEDESGQGFPMPESQEGCQE